MPYDEICYQRVKQDRIESAIKNIEETIKRIYDIN